MRASWPGAARYVQFESRSLNPIVVVTRYVPAANQMVDCLSPAALPALRTASRAAAIVASGADFVPAFVSLPLGETHNSTPNAAGQKRRKQIIPKIIARIRSEINEGLHCSVEPKTSGTLPLGF